MFDIYKEVPRLELCKKLKKLGYPQDGGGWYWLELKHSTSYEKKELAYFSYAEIQIIKKEAKKWEQVLEKANVKVKITNTTIDRYKAPTVRELIEWLPSSLRKDPFYYYLIINKSAISYERNITVNLTVSLFSEGINNNLANALAKMVIWLAENNYVEFNNSERR